MQNGIPKRPAMLAVFLGNLITGDDKHHQDAPLPKEVRDDIEATKAELESLNGRVQTSTGQLRQDAADRREFLRKAVERADKFRGAVVMVHGSKGPALADYGLVSRRNPRKPGSAESVGASPQDARLKRAQVHLARMQGQYEKEKKRMSALETRIAEQEARVARAFSAASHEPPAVDQAAPSYEPPSSSGAI